MTSRTAVVLAGGLGTRLLRVTGGLIPKAMVPVNGIPFLDYKLQSLADMGITSVVLLIGEKGALIEEHIAARTSTELDIRCLYDGATLLGTGGSIAAALQFLPEKFWVTYGDSFVFTNLDDAERHCLELGTSAALSVLHNRDQLELSNTTVKRGLVTSYSKSTSAGQHEWIDYGLLLLPKTAFAGIPLDCQTDLGVVVQKLIAAREMCAWEVQERFWDVGTPESLAATEVEFRSRFRNGPR